MALTNSYLKSVYETVEKRNPNEPEFQQAVYEVLESLEPVVEARPELEKNGIMEFLVLPVPFLPISKVTIISSSVVILY